MMLIRLLASEEEAVAPHGDHFSARFAWLSLISTFLGFIRAAIKVFRD